MSEKERAALLKRASDLRKDLRGLQRELSELNKDVMEHEVSKRTLHKIQTLHSEIQIIYDKLDDVYDDLKRSFQ